jgi:tRNA 2-thiocytidine biosynthesis protein TtcA
VKGSKGKPIMNASPGADTDQDVSAEGCHPLFRDVPASVEFNKLRKRLLRGARQAIDDFSTVQPGER